MRVMYGLLALSSKECKDRIILAVFVTTSGSHLHGILAKALVGMVFQIGCQGLVLGVLEPTHTAKCGLAFASSTRKKVAKMAFVILNRDVFLKKT